MSSEVANFFPPDYVPQLSVRDWLAQVPDGTKIISELEMALPLIRDTMGLTGGTVYQCLCTGFGQVVDGRVWNFHRGKTKFVAQ